MHHEEKLQNTNSWWFFYVYISEGKWMCFSTWRPCGCDYFYSGRLHCSLETAIRIHSHSQHQCGLYRMACVTWCWRHQWQVKLYFPTHSQRFNYTCIDFPAGLEMTGRTSKKLKNISCNRMLSLWSLKRTQVSVYHCLVAPAHSVDLVPTGSGCHCLPVCKRETLTLHP